jgi:hypothetical protein
MIVANKKITIEDEKKILELYKEGKTGVEILKAFNFKFKTPKTIYDCIKRFGVKTREKWEYSNHDHFYFSKIDSANKAYVLGLMLADGWIDTDRHTVAIQLTEDDAYIIEKIKEEWKTTNKIINCVRKPIVRKDTGKTYICKPMKRISIGSPKMLEDLKNLGLKQNKSLTITLPIIGEDYDGDLFRGIIDGDGSIYLHSNGKDICIRINGSHYLVAQSALYLTQRLGITYRIPAINDSISYIDYSIKEDVFSLYKFLYKNIDESFCIERKRDAIKNYIM